MNHHLKIFLTITFLSLSSIGKGQLIVDNFAPYDDQNYLVQSVLLNTGIVVSNVKFNGSLLPPSGAAAQMIGFFQGSATNIGIGDGVLLNTGNINDANGPNDSGSDGIDNGTPGDVDLDALSGVTTFNAAILEFDFETVTDGISFRYVFASEEYNEYVCSGFNDVFGFFVSGPGVTGPFSNGAKNIALVPSTSTYVGINAVNNGTVGFAGMPGGCGGPGDPGLNNTPYFIDNEALGAQSIQYDGFTTVLTAQTTLTPCETYHMKIAVADAGDGIFDSGVFLEAASFGAIGIQVEVGSIGTSVATMIEGCDSLRLIFSRAGPTTSPLTINYNVTGSATNGIDYPTLSGTIVVPVDSSSISFYLTAVLDGLPEGTESITITIPANLNNATCLDDVPSIATITIINTDPLTLQASNDTLICPGDNAPLLATVTNGIPPYTYTWTPATNLSCTNCPNPTANPSNTTTYTVEVTDDCGTAILTEDVTVNTGGMTLTPTNNNLVGVEGCKDASFTFTRTGSTANPVTIYFTIGGTASNDTDYVFIADSIVILAGQSSVELIISAILDGLVEPNESVIITTIPDPNALCAGPPITLTLFIMNVDPLAIVASNDTIICGGISTMITAEALGGVPILTYSWFDGSDTLGVGPSGDLNIQPDVNTTYTVTVSDTCGNPVAMEQVNVIVTTPPPSIASVQDTAYEGCRDALFTVTRSDTSTSELVVYYTISGTAANGTDYSTIWDSIIIPAGSSSSDIFIYPQIDALVEGDETIILTLNRDSTDTICYVIPFTDTVFLKNINPITIDVPPVTICPGESATLVATSTGGVGSLAYVWNLPGEFTNSITASPTDTTYYSIIVTDTCGTTQTKLDAMIAVRSVLGSIASAGITAYEGCKNTEFTFSIPTELPSDFTIDYVLSGSASVGSDFDPVPSSITIPAGDLTAVLEITTLLDGTIEGLETIVVTINPSSFNDTAFCSHEFVASVDIADVEPLTLSVGADTSVCNFTVPLLSQASGGFGPLSFIWDNGAGIGPEQYVHPGQPTTYTVIVTDSCQSGVATDSILIDIDCEYLFFIPNSFTPNEDGLNDLFNARWKGMKTYKMQIYNRWGDFIFSTDDRRKGWDGTGNGGEKLSEQEVYVYIFETTDFLDLPHTYVGKITLIQ